MEEKLKRCEEVRNELIINNNRIKKILEEEQLILGRMEETWDYEMANMLREAKSSLRINWLMFGVAVIGTVTGIIMIIKKHQINYAIYNMFFLFISIISIRLNSMRVRNLKGGINDMMVYRMKNERI